MSIDFDPFHEGERRVQQRAGQTQEADRNSPMIACRIPAGAVAFLKEQSLFVMALPCKDELWCLPLLGKPGWISAPTPDHLRLDLSMALAPVDSRILHAAAESLPVGGVILDFQTRRRLRINGRLTQDPGRSLTLSVVEAYPNCPKYITRRLIHWREIQGVQPASAGVGLSEEQQNAFRTTDILFIASQHATRGLDASHRGGDPGFVECPSPDTLRFPDFLGNGLFNTLGNLEIDHHVGILLPDFAKKRWLEVTGTAQVIYGDLAGSRVVEVRIKRWEETCLAGVETQAELSPFNP